jgi:hypothetical protein
VDAALIASPKTSVCLSWAVEHTVHRLRFPCALSRVEVNGIVADACAARNGWKVILGRFAPEKDKTISTPPQIS